MDHLILSGIRRAVRESRYGTVLNALPPEQQHEIANAIKAILAEHNAAVDTIKPVPEQVADLEARLEELSRAYSETISPLSCARVLAERLTKGIPADDAGNRKLLTRIGMPDDDARMFGHMVLQRDPERDAALISRLIGRAMEDER